jgi:hypothetical protein
MRNIRITCRWTSLFVLLTLWVVSCVAAPAAPSETESDLVPTGQPAFVLFYSDN